jgi:hypothetical protein
MCKVASTPPSSSQAARLGIERDGDFQRGINQALANNWIMIDLRNRYRYRRTATGYAVAQTIR